MIKFKNKAENRVLSSNRSYNPIENQFVIIYKANNILHTKQV